MNLKELRVGNLVKGPAGNIYPCNVATMYKLANERSNISPIPLTEEWLKKFGFKNEGLKLHMKKNDAAVIFFLAPVQHKTTEWFPWIGRSFDTKEKSHVILNAVKYVHQLQNLYFALTVTELTIQQ